MDCTRLMEYLHPSAILFREQDASEHLFESFDGSERRDSLMGASMDVEFSEPHGSAFDSKQQSESARFV